MIKGKDFIEEKQKLKSVVDVVKKTKKDLIRAMESVSSFNIKKLKEIRENPAANSADFIQFLGMLRDKNVAFNMADKYIKLDELEHLESEPYFSRIDLKDKLTEDIEKRYIGKFGFTDDQDNPVVIDWRARLATVYYKYRYPQKNVEYETPDGVVTKDLLLKRTFDIEDGSLIKFYNNDIKLDESEIIIDKLEERTGGVLEDIVETIQNNQHQIINADPRRVTIVQGTVGSGKSTVAIHKLSYIFFNYPEIITPEKSILIAKNQILVGYLSTLFPKLGIFDINYGTLRDVIYNLIFKEEMNIDFDLGKNKSLRGFNRSDLDAILTKLNDAHRLYQNKVESIFEKKENEVFAGFVYDSTRPIKENLNDAIDDLEKEIKFQKDFVKENPNHPRSDLFGKNIKIMKGIIKDLKLLRKSVKSKLLEKFLNDFKIGEDKFFGYRDLLIYIIIYAELFGFREYQKFEYCVIDEGQDFNILEYFVLNKLVQNGRFCILGDLNQSFGEQRFKRWEEISDIISGSKKPQKFILKTNYRSTKPIVDLANCILKPYTNLYLPESINRKGTEPNIKKFPTFNDVSIEFMRELKSDLKNVKKSIGIICMNKKYFNNTDKLISKLNLNDRTYIKLQSDQRTAYLPRALYLTDFENCKGLEFGKVYVLGLNLDRISTFQEAKKAFVAVTRAMDKLSIYSHDD